MRIQAGSAALLVVPGGLWDVFAVYLRRELLDSFRIEIIGFTVALVAMVGVMTRSGGVQGMVQQVQRFARGVRSTLAVTFAAGLRALLRRLLELPDRRELHAAAHGSSADLAREARLHRRQYGRPGRGSLRGVDLDRVRRYRPTPRSFRPPGIMETAYAIFFQTLPYRFYSIFALCFVALVIWTGRDFGPMRGAERRARRTGQLVRDGGLPMVSAEMTDLRARPRPAPARAQRRGSHTVCGGGRARGDLPAGAVALGCCPRIPHGS